jgi:large subunit ribosomal protein L30
MFAIIRIRSTAGIWHEIDETLKMLRLVDINNCVLVPETPDYKGMLHKVKDFVTWGEVDNATLTKMLEKRLRLKGNVRIDAKILKEATKFDSFEKLADALITYKVKLKDFERVSPVIRLTPPSKGYRSTKEPYPKGDLGYRGKEINGLLERMI